MGGNREEIMLSATSTTVQQALQYTWTSGNRDVFHMQHRFQNLPYFMHSNTHFREEKRKPTKRKKITPTKNPKHTTHPAHYNKMLQLPAGPVILYSSSKNDTALKMAC